MTAKDKHRLKMVLYWGNPNNEFIDRQTMFTDVLKIKSASFYQHFSVEELFEIEGEAAQMRRDRSARQRTNVLKSLYKTAIDDSSVPAAKEFLDRTEGKVTDKHEVTGKDGEPIVIVVEEFKE